MATIVSQPERRASAKSAAAETGRFEAFGVGAGVDGSKVMAGIAAENAKANGLAHEQGGPVSIVSGCLEEIAQLPVDKACTHPTLLSFKAAFNFELSYL